MPLSCLVMALHLAAAPLADLPATLSLDEALRLAHAQHPALHVARGQLAAGLGRTVQKRAALLPALLGTASYQRTTANFVPRPGFVPSGTRLNASSSNLSGNFLSLGVSASLLVYDFSYSIDAWRAALASKRALDHNERSVALNVDYNVRGAYFLAHSSHAMVQVAQETVANLEKHLAQIEGYIEAGTRADIDLAQARSDVAAARVTLINARNAEASAKLSLNQAMGIEAPVGYTVLGEAMPPIVDEDSRGDALIDEALRARPEICSLDAAMQAAQLTENSIWGAFWPSLGVSAQYTDQGPSLGEAGWNWNVMATLSWNAFSGGLTQGQLDEARANAVVVRAQREAQRQQVRLDVEQARFAVRAGKEATTAAADAADNARELLKSAEGRYEAGVGSVIELGDAQVSLTSALAQQVQAAYQLALARASLQKALGRLW